MMKRAVAKPPLPRKRQRQNEGVLQCGDTELERRWQRLCTRLQAVVQRLHTEQRVRTDAQEWVTMYSDVAALCAQNDHAKKKMMYVYLRDFVRAFVAKQLLTLRTLSGTQLLAEYVRRWNMSMLFVAFMKRVLHHLHTFWIPSNANNSKRDPVKPLDKLLIFYWREELLSQLDGIIDIVLQLIDDDRRGKVIDHAIVKGILDNLVALGANDLQHSNSRKSPLGISALYLYVQIFEQHFLQRTRAFYAAEAERIMRVNCVNTFMKTVVKRLNDETARGVRLLHANSTHRLRAVVEEQLVGVHMAYLHREAEAMVRDSREEQLTLIYKLLQRVEGGLNPVRDILTKHIVTEGTQIIHSYARRFTPTDDIRKSLPLVADLLHLHNSRISMVRRCFDAAPLFVMSVGFAFRAFMNKPVGSFSMPEILAYYADHILRHNGVAFVNNSYEHEHDRFVPIPTHSAHAVHTPQMQSSTLLNHRDQGQQVMTASQDFMQHDSSSLPPIPRTPSQSHCQGSDDDTNTLTGILHNTTDITQCQEERLGAKFQDPLLLHMDHVIRLFVYIEDKDMFCESYRRLFAKRLLASHNEDIEREFISKLKMEMGPVFTGKLSGMLHDVAISNEVRRSFEQTLQEQARQCTTASIEEDAAVGLNGSTAMKTEKTNEDGMHGNEPNTSMQVIYPKLDFSAHVLNALYWPSFQSDTLRIPPALEDWHRRFAAFYLGKKESRKLTWVHQQSTAHVAATYGNHKYTLVMSAFQACALLLFNDTTRLTLAEMCAQLNTVPSVLRQHLLPLVASKRHPILFCRDIHGNDLSRDELGARGGALDICEDVDSHVLPRSLSGSDVTQTMMAKHAAFDGTSSTETGRSLRNWPLEEDRKADCIVYELNERFSSRQVRIQIPANVTRLTAAESKVARNSVVVDRSTQIDAALVRTMKTRKRLTHNELIAHVLEQVAPLFKPYPKLVKLRLERLIEREYIDRDPECPNTYLYNT